MIANEPAYKSQYEKWKDHIKGGPFPAPGNKYFWKSAIMTHHGANYYLSAKVTSIRNNGTEMLNRENLKGFYLPLGSTNFMTTGQEYKNIFPVWDWTRIPGTTAVSNPSTAELRWYHFGSNRFAGGTGNSKNGLIAYEHVYNGVSAWKSYFFFGDAVLCLGCGIEAAKTQMITTSVNQCFLRGDVYINESGNTRKLTDERIKTNQLNWVHHDHIGYIFPHQKNVVVQQKEQSGSWSEISDSGSPEIITHNVFSLWTEHGVAPINESYCYIVMPDKSLPAFEKEAADHGFEIISNTHQVQAIRNIKQQNYGVVFYQPKEIRLDDDLIISSNKPLVLYLEKKTDGYEISVADPLFTEKTVTVTISHKPKGKNVKSKKENSVITIKLPDGDYTGNTITTDYKF
jgi:chondroitin AC lyase